MARPNKSNQNEYSGVGIPVLDPVLTLTLENAKILSSLDDRQLLLEGLSQPSFQLLVISATLGPSKQYCKLDSGPSGALSAIFHDVPIYFPSLTAPGECKSRYDVVVVTKDSR